MAGLLGSTLLQKWNVSIPAMALAGGLTLFAVSFMSILEQFSPGKHEAPPSDPPAPAAALSPLAFPMIVTPYGVAVLIVLLALKPEMALIIFGLTALVVILDLLAMLFAHKILKWLMLPLLIFGAVLGIMQVALGIQLVIFAIRLLFAGH